MATAKAQLAKATKNLLLKWDNTTEHWNDPVSRSMEKQYIEPLRDSVRSSIAAMDSIGEVIDKAEQGCR
jgi:hypothetical protein